MKNYQPDTLKKIVAIFLILILFCIISFKLVHAYRYHRTKQNCEISTDEFQITSCGWSIYSEEQGYQSLLFLHEKREYLKKGEALFMYFSSFEDVSHSPKPYPYLKEDRESLITKSFNCFKNDSNCLFVYINMLHPNFQDELKLYENFLNSDNSLCTKYSVYGYYKSFILTNKIENKFEQLYDPENYETACKT